MNTVTPVLRARQRAKRLYKAPRFQDAYVAGARSAMLGWPPERCPYPIEHGRRTWRTAYRRAWLRGHESAAVID